MVVLCYVYVLVCNKFSVVMLYTYSSATAVVGCSLGECQVYLVPHQSNLDISVHCVLRETLYTNINLGKMIVLLLIRICIIYNNMQYTTLYECVFK